MLSHRAKLATPMAFRSTVTPLPRRAARWPVLALCAAQVALAQPVATPSRSPLAASPGDARRFHATLEATRFRALLDADWEWRMQQSPEWATSLGDHRYDDRLTDASPQAQARREEHQRQQLKLLSKVDVDVLDGEDRISYDFALQDAQLAVDWQRFPAMNTRVLSSMDGLQVSLPSMMADFPVRTELDAQHALARLQAMPARIAQDIAWLREGKRLGWVTFRASLAQVPDQIDRLLARPLTEQPLLAPFTHLPDAIPAERRTALQDQAAGVLQSQVAPAFVELRKVVVDELLPASPEDGAMGAYPDGAEAYRLFVRENTTLALDAQAVHAIGLAEVARIGTEIAAVMKQVGFAGTYPEFVDQLAHDPKFFYASGDELLAGYRDLAKRVDPQLTRLFLTLPRAPYGIRAIPDYLGVDHAEYYSPGAADGSTPGWFNANVTAFAHRPRWRMPFLFLHEGVPGHHLQTARAYELATLPAFRRAAYVDAYVEGWALYAEGLGNELGLYDDPYARYGYLQAQAWRSARLVVDTGIHALGWTREQAVAYLVDTAGLPRDDAVAEVERYYLMPGEALGYKLGELRMRELRRKARDALGARFDLRAFDQELVDHGALPLPVLDRVIAAWIARVRATPAPAEAR